MDEVFDGAELHEVGDEENIYFLENVEIRNRALFLKISNQSVAKVVEFDGITHFARFPITELPTSKAKDIVGVQDGTKRLFFDAFEMKVRTGQIDKKLLSQEIIDTIKTDSRLCTLEYRFAVGLGTAAGEFLDITALIDVIRRLLVDDTQGATYDGENYISFGSITELEASSWNKYNLPKNWIYPNTEVTQVKPNANEHHYTLSFKEDQGFNTQEVITLNAYSRTEPFLRPQLVDDKDPYLGDEVSHGSSKWHDAVVELEFLYSKIDEKTNELEDVYNQAYQGLGFGLLHTEALPNPDYQLSKITNTKTGNILYSQGSATNSNSLIKASGWNNIQVGEIKGLAMNSDQAVEMQVKIPKEQAQAKLGIEGDIYGNGFVAKFIEESSEGAETIDSVRSDSYEVLLKKAYTESPELAEPYLYNVYTCAYPTKVGDSCGLKMHIGGMDSSKHIGKIYIADGGGRTTGIPVYLNYHLLGSYFELNISDKTDPYKIDIMNTHNEPYTKISLEYKSVDDDSYQAVPSDMIAKATTCNLDSGLQPGTQCAIYFDFSTIDSDAYQFRINGIKAAAKLGAPDQFDVKVRVD